MGRPAKAEWTDLYEELKATPPGERITRAIPVGDTSARFQARVWNALNHRLKTRRDLPANTAFRMERAEGEIFFWREEL